MQAAVQRKSAERNSRKRRKASEISKLSGCDGVIIKGAGEAQAHLQFIRIFKKKGKQGIVGLCKVNGEIKVFKVSRYINHTVRHESNVLKSLRTISSFCPYFCTGGMLWSVEVGKDFREQTNPFALGTAKHTMTVDLLTMDYTKGRPLSSLMKEEQVSDASIFGAVRQIMGAMILAQQEVDFTHYDLHSSNVLIEPCPSDSVALFITRDAEWQTPTYGLHPVIIDFGFSHARDCRKKPIYSSLAHTDIGFLTHRSDHMADAKLFLISLAYEMKMYREESHLCVHFRKLVKRIFKKLRTDASSGWDDGYTKLSAIDCAAELTDAIEAKSQLFDRYNHFSLDIMQTMIVLPLRKKPYENIALAFKVVDRELYILSNELGSTLFTLHVFQKMVDIAAALRRWYQSPASRMKANKVFKKMVLQELDKVTKYCMPKINFEKLLCGLYVYADCIEGVLYDELGKLWAKKTADYSRMDHATPSNILDYIDTMLPDAYMFSASTQIRVTDTHRRTFQSFTLTRPEYQYINKILPKDRALALKQIYQSRLEAPELSDEEEMSWDTIMSTEEANLDTQVQYPIRSVEAQEAQEAPVEAQEAQEAPVEAQEAPVEALVENGMGYFGEESENWEGYPNRDNESGNMAESDDENGDGAAELGNANEFEEGESANAKDEDSDEESDEDSEEEGVGESVNAKDSDEESDEDSEEEGVGESVNAKDSDEESDEDSEEEGVGESVNAKDSDEESDEDSEEEGVGESVNTKDSDEESDEDSEEEGVGESVNTKDSDEESDEDSEEEGVGESVNTKDSDEESDEDSEEEGVGESVNTKDSDEESDEDSEEEGVGESVNTKDSDEESDEDSEEEGVGESGNDEDESEDDGSGNDEDESEDDGSGNDEDESEDDGSGNDEDESEDDGSGNDEDESEDDGSGNDEDSE